MHELVSSFAVRLRDVLGTLEAAALLGAAETRLRGLGEQLQFACLALPCDEALVALELGALGRLDVPGVASAEGWRATQLSLLPSGTPFAFLLGGGGGYATEIEASDSLLEALAPALSTAPSHAIFVPVRVGASVLGGAALFRSGEPFADGDLGMAERLAEVLSLTVESYRTERVLMQLFATVLPDLCAPDAPTDFVAELERYIHQIRLGPEYRRRLQLAATVGRIAAVGGAETRLVVDVLARMEAYVAELTTGVAGGDQEVASEALTTDELYE